MNHIAIEFAHNPMFKGWKESTSKKSWSVLEPKSPNAKLKVPISQFYSGNRQINCNIPLEVVIFEDEGCYIAQSESLHIIATGGGIDDAISDFHDQLIYFFDYYSGLNIHQVTGQATQLLKVYAKHFHEETVNVA